MMSEGSVNLISPCALVGFGGASLTSILECLRVLIEGADVLVLTADRLGSGFASEQTALTVCFMDGLRDTS